MHSALAELPFEEGVVAHVSFYIHCHVAARTFSGTVHKLYLANSHPEAQSHAVMTCYPFSDDRNVVAAAWHSQPCDDGTNVLSKLVRKGGPCPTSVRYVAGLMKRCAASNDLAARAIKNMLCSRFLGGYKHSHVCADPSQHVKFVQMSIDQLLEYAISSSTTRQLHSIVSEYVCANSLLNTALMTSVGPLAARHARGVAAGTLRAFGRSTPPRESSTFSCFMTLAKALNVNNSNRRATTMLTDDEIALADSWVGVMSPLPLLASSGLATDSELSAVKACAGNSRNHTLKSMRMLLKHVRNKPRQFMCRAMHSAIKKARLVVHTTSKQVQQAQEIALPRNARSCAAELPYCQSCCTFRATIAGAKMPRTRSGVSVDIVTGELRCNNCNATDLVHIDLVGRSVTLLGKSLDAETSVGPVSICCRCAQPTVFKSPFGEYLLCASCKKQSDIEVYRPKACVVCGADSGSVASTWCEVLTPGGSIDMAWFCRDHSHMTPDRLVLEKDLDAVLDNK